MSELNVEHRDGVRRLELNRPQQLNSLTDSLCRALQRALADAAADADARCVLVTGAGRGFCAGQDLSEVGVDSDSPKDLGAILERGISPIVRMMRGMEKPVLVAVNGVAAGAGANLALAGDVVIARRSARFVQAFRHVGLIPDAGGTWLLPRLAGHARALGAALFGDPLDAEQAEQWGLIWKCVDDEAFDDAVRDAAARLATGPTAALGLAKRAFALGAHNTLDRQLDLERDLQRAAARGADYREGVRAFLAKRAPEFSGR